MKKIRKIYQRVVLWIIGKLADTIVRPAPMAAIEKLGLKPFMHIVAGENGIRHIGIYCDGLWKALNGFPEMGIAGEIPLRIQVQEQEQEAVKPKSRRVKKKGKQK